MTCSFPRTGLRPGQGFDPVSWPQRADGRNVVKLFHSFGVGKIFEKKAIFNEAATATGSRRQRKIIYEWDFAQTALESIHYDLSV